MLKLILIITILAANIPDNSFAQAVKLKNKKGESSKIDSTKSLIFEDDEMIKINEAVDAAKNNTPFKLLEKTEQAPVAKGIKDEESYVYLGSILYRSPKNWMLYLNNKKISYQSNNPEDELYIKAINSNYATIVWSMSVSKWRILTKKTQKDNPKTNANNQVETVFNLAFNQTFVLDEEKIVEGKIINSQPSLSTELDPKPLTSPSVSIEASAPAEIKKSEPETMPAPTEALAPTVNPITPAAAPAAPAAAPAVKTQQ